MAKCPILPMGGGLTYERMLYDCLKEKCAWYIHSKRTCAIRMIAIELYRLHEEELRVKTT